MTANAESLSQLGNDLAHEQRWHDAEQAYKRAADVAPEWSVSWYNLGLLYKRQRRWQESLDANQKALALDPEDGDSWWNLGIAAMAAGDWQLARQAWRSCGIPLPDGDGPPELDYGLVPIRLNPESDAEVVWSRRIDPARAIMRKCALPSLRLLRGRHRAS
jgi:tetratricopeptide (TPR) repeat protein